MKLIQALTLLLAISAVSARLGVQDKDDKKRNNAPAHSKKIKDQWIVKIAKGKDAKGKDAKGLLNAFLKGNPHAQIIGEYSKVFLGFAVTGIPEAAMRNLQRMNPDVILSFEADTYVQASEIWGLDRIDQTSLPLNNNYSPDGGLDGTGVDIYIIDTGVRTSHNEFSGRITKEANCMGNPCNESTGAASDPDGHGTHVAGTAAGSTFGVAKKANIIPVQVLDANGGTTSGVIRGIEWVVTQHGTSTKPSVANMSLGGGLSTSLNNAVAAAVNAGVVMVVAAGNENTDACTTSPASAASALTVASSTSSDNRSSFSNYGTCVDIFAPGSSIKSAWIGSNTATNTISGTSMASPHVAGAAALLIQHNPAITVSGVATALTNAAVGGAISGANTSQGNKLLHVGAGFVGVAPTNPPPSTSNMEIELKFDNYPSETTFVLQKKASSSWTSVTSSSGASATAGQVKKFPQTLQDGEYRFVINDSYGDGICCSYGNGYYRLKNGSGSAFATGGEFDSSATVTFFVTNGVPSLYPTTPPTTTAPPPTTTTPEPNVDLVMFLQRDNYPSETSFSLHQEDSNGNPVGSAIVAGGFGSYNTVTATVSLPSGRYLFRINDSYGDGICCSYGNGYYTLTANGTLLTNPARGDFGNYETISIEVAGGAATIRQINSNR